MGVTGALVTLDRLRRQSPTGLVSLTRRMAGSAIDNSRQSLESLARAIEDRTHSMEHLESNSGPGDLASIPVADCWRLLDSKTVGRLVYVARAGVPDVVPVNFIIDGHDLLIRSAPGPKLQAAERRERVAFEVDEIDEAGHHGWSVIVSGVAEIVPPEKACERAVPLPWANGPRRHTIRIRTGRISGRTLG